MNTNEVPRNGRSRSSALVTGDTRPAVVDALIRSVLADESGATITLEGSNYTGTTGYVVALGNPHADTVTVTTDGIPWTIAVARFVYSQWDYATANGYAFGSWRNQGTVCLDVVEVDQSLPRAIAKGMSRNQIAIYSLSTGTDIRTGGTGS